MPSISSPSFLNPSLLSLFSVDLGFNTPCVSGFWKKKLHRVMSCKASVFDSAINLAFVLLGRSREEEAE